jgi:hypothetical protein
MNNLSQLNFCTVTGLQSLELDELTAVNFSADVIDGDIIYYNRIEGNEIIVDTRLTLTNTGVISVGGVLISDIELTYLDGVTSNIQTQINDISNINISLGPRVTALEISDASQNILISALQSVDVSQNSLLTNHTNQINNLNYAIIGQTNSITNLQLSDISQNLAIADLQIVNTNLCIKVMIYIYNNIQFLL